MKLSIYSNKYTFEDILKALNERFKSVEDMEQRIYVYCLEIARNFSLNFNHNFNDNVLEFRDQNI